MTMTKTMNKEEFLKELGDIMNKFYGEIYTPMVNLVNEYIENNETISLYDLSYQENFKKLDDMALLTAWVIDRLDGRIGCISDKTYRGSLLKKIRKALGYTL